MYTNSVCILCVYTAKIVGAGDQENYNQCICLYCVCVLCVGVRTVFVSMRVLYVRVLYMFVCVRVCVMSARVCVYCMCVVCVCTDLCFCVYRLCVYTVCVCVYILYKSKDNCENLHYFCFCFLNYKYQRSYILCSMTLFCLDFVVFPTF